MRTAGAVLIAVAFVLLAMGCNSRSYPMTPAGAKASKAQQQRIQNQFP